MNAPPLTPEQAAAEQHVAALANGSRCTCPRCTAPDPLNRAERRARSHRR